MVTDHHSLILTLTLAGARLETDSPVGAHASGHPSREYMGPSLSHEAAHHVTAGFPFVLGETRYEGPCLVLGKGSEFQPKGSDRLRRTLNPPKQID